MFMVMTVNHSVKAEIYGKPVDVPMVWAEGMIGAIPVFNSYESAEKYCGGNKDIQIFEVKEANYGGRTENGAEQGNSELTNDHKHEQKNKKKSGKVGTEGV